MKKMKKLTASFSAAAMMLCLLGGLSAGAAEVSSQGTTEHAFWAMDEENTVPSASASALVNCDFTHKAELIADTKSRVYTADFGKVNNIAQGGTVHPVFEKTFKMIRGGNSNYDTMAFYNGLDRKQNGYDGTVRLTVAPGADGAGLYKIHILASADVGTDGAFRAKRYAVRNATAGVSANTSYGSEFQYNAAKAGQTLTKQLRVLEGVIEIQEGDNVLEISAPEGENAPEFVAAAFEKLTPSPAGTPIWMNFTGCGNVFAYQIAASNGSDKAVKKNLGKVIHFDEATVGTFGLANGVALTDRICLPGFMEGAIEVYVQAEEAGLYDIGILAPAEEATKGRKFHITANNDMANAADTQETVTDISNTQVVSEGGLNYLSASVRLKAGTNKLTLTGADAGGAPAFHGLCATKSTRQPAPEVEAVIVGAYRGDETQAGDNQGADSATLLTAEFQELSPEPATYSGITWSVTHQGTQKIFDTVFTVPVTIEGGVSVKAALGIRGVYAEAENTQAAAQLKE